jgi:hypothetical protein
VKRLVLSLVCVVTLAVTFVPMASASPSPYPATLLLQRGLTMSKYGRSLPLGTTIPSSQTRWVMIKSSGPAYRWGVWQKNGGPAQYPVRSIDGGVHWTAAGPQLATDWVGGSLYYVTKVITESSSSVVMVSNSIIDVTVDGGRQWFQYLYSAGDWSINRHTVAGCISIHVSPPSWATSLPQGSYAIYNLDLTHLRWSRVAQSLS